MKINLENAPRIIDDYMPLIIATVDKFKAFEREEAIEESKMILIETVLTYDESKGSFGNFLKQSLNYYFWDKSKKPRPISLDAKSKDTDSLLETIRNDIDIESDLLKKEKYEKLYQALARLDETDLKLIRLKYFLNYSNKEIAKDLGLAVKTVKNKHTKILQNLQIMYKSFKFDHI